MLKTPLRMPSFDGVGAGQTATAKLPIGHKYHELIIVYTGVLLAEMTEIRVLANGKVIHRYSAEDRDVMNQFDGRAAASGELVIPFNRYGLAAKQMNEETALNCGPAGPNGRAIRSLHVEVDIDAAAVDPDLKLRALRSKADPDRGPGTVLHVMKYTRDAGGAGEFEISDIPYGQRTSAALNRTFFKEGGNLDKLEIERGGYTVFERTASENDRAQTDGVRTPQAGWYVYDTTENGYGGDVLPLVGYQDFRYKCELAAAQTLEVWQETLGELGD